MISRVQQVNEVYKFFIIYRHDIFLSSMLFITVCTTYVFCMMSLGFRDPEIGPGVPNHACLSEINKHGIDILHFIGFLCKINRQNNGECNILNDSGRKSKYMYTFCKIEAVKIC